MNTLRGTVMVVIAGLLIAGGLQGQDKKDEKKDPPPVLGVLPPNWGKLGLSEEQRKKVYAVADAYKPKVEDVRKKLTELEKQLQELRTKERGEQEAVLTDEQKKKLKLIQMGKDPADEKKP